MKKILAIIISCVIILSLAGCGGSVDNSVNVNKFSRPAMVEIGDGLWYDSATRIVYWWNGRFNTSYAATAPSPYYAPNGLPYRYNPNTNTFEEIDYGQP